MSNIVGYIPPQTEVSEVHSSDKKAKPFSKMKKPELLEAAAAAQIEVPDSATVDQLVALLTAAESQDPPSPEE